MSYRWPTAVSVVLALLFIFSWYLPLPTWGEHSFCDVLSATGIAQRKFRDPKFSEYTATKAEQAEIRWFPPGRICRLYGVQVNERTGTWVSNPVVIAEEGAPAPSSFVWYCLIVALPFGVAWLLRWTRDFGGQASSS
jgi:hypothetical protein